MTVTQSFGQDIRKWRKKRGLTLQGLAVKSGESLDLITEIESGKGNTRITTIQKLVRALEIEITFKP